MENVTLFLQKIGTYIADRRVWTLGIVVALLTLTGYAGIPPELQGEITDAFGESYTALQGWLVASIVLSSTLGKLIGLVMVAIALIKSHTDRPPSGLRYKEVAVPPLATSVSSSTFTAATTEAPKESPPRLQI